jgi:flavorubredoxin
MKNQKSFSENIKQTAIKIKEDIYWLGVDNPEGRDFHGINTPRGGSYNSYLVLDEKPTIVEATSKPFFDQYLQSLKSIIEPAKIEYIIIDHAEPDHAGAIKELMNSCCNAKIICTEKCKEFLISAFAIDGEFIIVKEGDETSIGKRKFRFFPHPMIHWPETMFSYLVEDRMLFSGDLFGTEISHEKHFADEIDDFTELTRDYFAIVMRPFAIPVKNAIEKVRKLDLDFIMPSHGPIYRNELNKIIDYYEKLATCPEEDKVLIIYDSIWHSTEKMAKAIAEGVKNCGYDTTIHDLSKSNLVTLMAEAMTSKAIALGSLTILGSYHPFFESLFPLLKANNQKGKNSTAFGSFGWASSAVPQLKIKLEELDYNVFECIDYRFGPKNEADFDKLKNLGKKLCEGEK